MAGTETPDIIGTGWAFPPRATERGGIALARRGEDVAQAIRIILSTPIGERRMRPEFGCAIHDYVFATNDPTTHGLIRHHVVQALELWEPRIELVEVRVHAAREDPGQVLVEIDYLLRATNERRNLVYPFYIIPGEPEEAD
jgi:phage baseplate assembly protein W